MLKNKYGELRSGWALTLAVLFVLLIQVLLGVAVALVAAVQVGVDAVTSDTARFAQATSQITSSVWLDYTTYTFMIGGLLLMFWLLYKRPLRQIGFYARGWFSQLMLGGALGAAFMSLAVFLLWITRSASLSGFNGPAIAQALFWAGLVKYIFVGFFEEILSRGYMMTALKTTRNRWVIILAPALVFGLLHILNDNVTFFSLANIALVGVLFAYLFIKTGRLWAPIGLHITWNFFQGYVFGIPVSGSGVPGSALMNTLFTGPDWLTGGAFGVEGGAICTLVILLGILFTRFYVKAAEPQEAFWTLNGDLPLTRL